jgi:hypothetical protein
LVLVFPEQDETSPTVPIAPRAATEVLVIKLRRSMPSLIVPFGLFSFSITADLSSFMI